MKGHCVFRRNHYFIKAGINSLQSESNQNIKNKVMAKAEQFLIVFLPLVELGFGCPPQFVAANTLPFSKLITFKYESFQENETKCKTSCTVVYKTSAFSTWELKYTRQYLKKAEHLSLDYSFHFSAVFHIFESTQTLVFMHTYRRAKVLQPHTHTLHRLQQIYCQEV